MILYHGTTERLLGTILRDGLRPRKPGTKGNWPKVPSGSGRVYMTEGYAMYYAFATTREKERLVVLAIDTDKLDPWMFVPDEDWIAQRMKMEDPSNTTPLLALTKRCRKLAVERADLWEYSLKDMGTVGYLGTIPPSAIVKYAIIEREAYIPLIFRGHDPSVGIMNHRIMGAVYRGWMDWLFVGKTEADWVGGKFTYPERTGVTVTEV